MYKVKVLRKFKDEDAVLHTVGNKEMSNKVAELGIKLGAIEVLEKPKPTPKPKKKVKKDD